MSPDFCIFAIKCNLDTTLIGLLSQCIDIQIEVHRIIFVPIAYLQAIKIFCHDICFTRDTIFDAHCSVRVKNNFQVHR